MDWLAAPRPPPIIACPRKSHPVCKLPGFGSSPWAEEFEGKVSSRGRSQKSRYRVVTTVMEQVTQRPFEPTDRTLHQVGKGVEGDAPKSLKVEILDDFKRGVCVIAGKTSLHVT